jgi:hypothetical protein
LESSRPEGVAKNNKIGLDLAAETGEVIAEFECGFFFTSIAVKGSFIHPVKANSMVLEENEKVTQRGDHWVRRTADEASLCVRRLRAARIARSPPGVRRRRIRCSR